MAEYNESQINSNETERISAEQERIENEAKRQTNETEREARETIRQSNESTRITFMADVHNTEDERIANEQVRINAENIRMANEDERLRKEIERQNAEELRQIAYNSSLYGRMDEAEDRLDSVDSQLAHNTILLGNIYKGDIPKLENVIFYSNNRDKINTSSQINKNVIVEGLDITSIDTQMFYFASGSKNVEIKDNNLNSTNMAVHLNSKNVENVKIMNNDVEGGNYPILVNSNSQGGSNLTICNNNIKSNGGDCIEINTPNQGVDTFKCVKIIGNTLESTPNGDTTHNNGFGIGIAQGQDIVVTGNIVTNSRNEALHVEDCTQNLAVVGNVFNSSYDGAWLQMGDKTKNIPEYTPVVNGLYAKTYLVNSNHFKKSNRDKTGKGIYLIYDKWGGSFIFNVANNRIEGFEYGIYANGSPYTIMDNTVVESCIIGLKANNGKYLGRLIMKNCDKLVELNGSCVIDELVSYSNISPTNLIINNITQNGLFSTINKLSYNQTHNVVTDSNNKTQIKLLPLSKVLDGNLFVKINYKYAETKEFLFKVNYVNNELKSDKIFELGYGSLGSGDLIVKDGFICVNLTCKGWDNYSIDVQTNIEGKYIFGK